MNWSEFSTKKLHQYFDIAVDQAVYIIPRFVLAFLIIWLGFKLIKKLSNLIDKALNKIGITDTLRPFISSIINVALKVILFMIIANIIGADITGLIAIFAATGFAIGMALQGSLGNFASGVLILSFRPYKVGDWVGVNEKHGKVEEIGIFNTKIITASHDLLIIPNSKITDNIVTNFSNKEIIRLDIKINIPYEESYPRIEGIIKSTIATIPLLLNKPVPEIGIIKFDSHYVEIAVRPYTEPDDYWDATFALNAALKKAFYSNKIKMAYAEGVELGPIGE